MLIMTPRPYLEHARRPPRRRHPRRPKARRPGLIRNDRGTITVLDRPGIEAAVCECYKVVNDEYRRLLG
jgi:hypothetical protein